MTSGLIETNWSLESLHIFLFSCREVDWKYLSGRFKILQKLVSLTGIRYNVESYAFPQILNEYQIFVH